MGLSKLGIKELPKAPKLKKMIGPSLVLLGLGLGSGELILWPYLSANFGLGIIWAAIVGITFQFFLNMEIERYTIVNGESVITGLARRLNVWAPRWFILSTLIPWIWPGIVLTASEVLRGAIGWSDNKILAVAMLLIAGFILTSRGDAYKNLELFQKVLILIGVPILFLIAISFANKDTWTALLRGVAGYGDNYRFLPGDIPLLTFLGALAYAGAGGNLNLAQSLYIKEKGFGMGKYGQKIGGILRKQADEYFPEGNTFETNKENLLRFKEWWKRINLEHLGVFWLTGLATIVVLSVLAYATSYGSAGSAKGINFIFNEAVTIGIVSVPIVKTGFLTIIGLMLFSTQMTVLDATSRIMAECNSVLDRIRDKETRIERYYFGYLWLQIFLQMAMILAIAKEPLVIVTIGGALNALSMFIYSILVLWLNNNLPEEVRPSKSRVLVLLFEIGFLGLFCFLTARQFF